MGRDRLSAARGASKPPRDAQTVGGRVEGGYRVATPFGTIAPYAAVQAQSFRTPTYSETDLTAGGSGSPTTPAAPPTHAASSARGSST